MAFFKRKKKVSASKEKSNVASDLQKSAFVFGIIGFFIPLFPIVAIVLGALTNKEKPNNWRSKWAIGLGIVGILSTLAVTLVILSVLINVVGNAVMSSFGL